MLWVQTSLIASPSSVFGLHTIKSRHGATICF
uniref:Uncharacterized protein n=1 Tax=Arundo donax TaxID=35708 RepID=A0A0A9C2V8_ARUDO